MALHGSVNVNGMELGRWMARRTTPLVGPDPTDEVHVYDCVVMHPDGRTAYFELEHRYGDGAMALASAVLAVQ